MMVSLAAIWLLSLAPHNPGQIGSWDFRSPVLAGNLEEVEALYRQVGSLKHPIHPDDREDVLSTFVALCRSSSWYGKVLTGVRLCFERGADPNALQASSLRIAAYHDKYGKVVERLLKYGAKPNVFNMERGSPLLAAVWQKNTKSVEALLQYKADPNLVSNHRRQLPLAEAARTGQADLAEMLLKAGAVVNMIEPGSRETALHAARTDHDGVVRLLLRRGASRTIRDGNGRTPLQAALKAGAKKTPKLLR